MRALHCGTHTTASSAITSNRRLWLPLNTSAAYTQHAKVLTAAHCVTMQDCRNHSETDSHTTLANMQQHSSSKAKNALPHTLCCAVRGVICLACEVYHHVTHVMASWTSSAVITKLIVPEMCCTCCQHHRCPQKPTKSCTYTLGLRDSALRMPLSLWPAYSPTEPGAACPLCARGAGCTPDGSPSAGTCCLELRSWGNVAVA